MKPTSFDPHADDSTTEAVGGTERILLVEDEEVVREVLAHTLRRYGYCVLDAAGAAQALALSASESDPIDLLVTDVVMPGSTGRALADTLGRHRPTMAVLYISGYPGEEIIEQGALDPDGAFLQKPFPPAVLARKVRDVLHGVRNN